MAQEHNNGDAQKVAIIGSGIAGLTIAWMLSKKHNITLFESNDYLGGHTHTVPVHIGDTSFDVDTGFIVCNDRNYPNFLKIMEQLKVQLQATQMSFSVRNEALNLEYNGHNLNTLFSQRVNLLRPKFYTLVRDIVRFNKCAKDRLASSNAPLQTLGQFVDELGLNQKFRENYLLPMVAAIWSCSVQQAEKFPLAFFLKFFQHHGLLDIANRPQWYVLKGGSHSYIDPITRDYASDIRLDSRVTKVIRTPEYIEVVSESGKEQFDQVVLACHSDQALDLIADPTSVERDVLQALEYQTNHVLLHCDTQVMPKHQLSWASWNFLVNGQELNAPARVTYCMNILQALNTQSPVLVSLNSSSCIREEKIYQEFYYDHPVYSEQSMAAQSRRGEICGKDRIHFCGAYWYSGFHEDGVRSALDVCSRFGESL